MDLCAGLPCKQGRKWKSSPLEVDKGMKDERQIVRKGVYPQYPQRGNIEDTKLLCSDVFLWWHVTLIWVQVELDCFQLARFGCC